MRPSQKSSIIRKEPPAGYIGLIRIGYLCFEEDVVAAGIRNLREVWQGLWLINAEPGKICIGDWGLIQGLANIDFMFLVSVCGITLIFGKIWQKHHCILTL
jgi:hypothetical protein